MFTEMQKAYMDEMCDSYPVFSAAKKFLFGWVDGADLMAAFLDWNTFRRLLCKYDRAATSKGGELKIRVKADAKARAALKVKSFKIGTADELTADKAHNKGDNFERIAKEKLTGEKWTKNSDEFTLSGDIIYKGEHVQVKLHEATLINAKHYEKLKAARA